MWPTVAVSSASSVSSAPLTVTVRAMLQFAAVNVMLIGCTVTSGLPVIGIWTVTAAVGSDSSTTS